MEIKNNIFKYIETHKLKIFSIFGIVIAFGIISTFIFNQNKNQGDIKEKIGYVDIVEEDNQEESTTDYVYVDIKGKVKTPGIYMMNLNDRVNDVILAAGGLIKGANTRYINLSKKVFDEMVIVIYSEEEIASKLEVINKNGEVPCICEESINDACTEKEYSEVSNEDEKTTEFVNINTATLEDLMSLPGIGESKAKAIIEYRKTNGNFENIENLMEVSGIGESVYFKIKNLITTG